MNSNRFSEYHLSEEPQIVTEMVPGKRSRKLLALQEELEGSIVSYPKSMPIGIKRARGAAIEDVDGNIFLDMFAGAGVLNLGHCNAEVLKYATDQQQELIHALDFPTENKMTAIRHILENLPDHMKGEYKVCFGGPTGSDAVEAAIKLAKIKTGRNTIVAFFGGYHGMTATALTVTSNIKFRKKLQSLVPDVHFIPYGYCYRCPFDKQPSTCSLECTKYFRMMLEDNHSGLTKPAAIIVEPVQGEGGNIAPPKGYLESLVEIAHDNDVLVIFDEIQSGFFRTGPFLSFMNYKAVPDIITISKGLGGVGFPISGLIYKKSIEAWSAGDHIGTFRGNQVSLAAANGAFDFVERHDVEQHVRETSKYFFERLETLRQTCPFIGDIRGLGLMIGIEFVKDVSTKEPDAEFTKRFRRNCFENGLLFEIGGHFDNVLRIVPPLIITQKMIDSTVKTMEKCLINCLFETHVDA